MNTAGMVMRTEFTFALGDLVTLKAMKELDSAKCLAMAITGCIALTTVADDVGHLYMVRTIFSPHHWSPGEEGTMNAELTKSLFGDRVVRETELVPFPGESRATYHGD